MSGRGRILAIGTGGVVVSLSIYGCVGLLEPKLRMTGGPLLRSSPDATAAASSSLFYPLEIGNHWAYGRTFSVQITPVGGDPQPAETIESSMDADLVGTEQRFGREYVVQVETVDEGGGSFESRYLYRQDKSGLYNADPEPTSAARVAGRDANGAAAWARALDRAPQATRGAYRLALARLIEKQNAFRDVALHGRASMAARIGATSGPLAGEIALLRYPLSTSSTWHVREDPLVVYTVEGQEGVALPAGKFNTWRIRIDWPGVFGPNDRAHVWYGRDGLIQLIGHFEGEATDANGNPIGTVVSDQTQALSALSLASNAATP